MALVKLTKKEYLGKGYVHIFQNNTTQEILYVPTTAEQYTSMGGKDGYLNNPTMAGHTWLCSSGETVKVDNPDETLHQGEYTKMGEEVFGVSPQGKFFKTTPDKVSLDEKIDDTVWQ